jgi:hypothetical protein
MLLDRRLQAQPEKKTERIFSVENGLVARANSLGCGAAFSGSSAKMPTVQICDPRAG